MTDPARTLRAQLAPVLFAMVLGAAGCAAPQGSSGAPAANGGRFELGSSPSSLAGAPQVRRLRKPGWVEVVSQVIASDDEAPSHARARALDQARIAAIEHVAGVRVKSGVLSFEQVRGQDASSLVQVLSSVRADALVVEERLIDTRTFDLPGDGYRVRIVMQANILDRSSAPDSGFVTELKLTRERFLHGEEVQLAVRASHEARIYVIGITEEGAAIILPNGYLPDTHVEAGEWIRFPGAELQELGVRLIATVPDGKRSAKEALFVVALRGDRRLHGLSPSRGKRFRAVEAQGAGKLLDDLLSPLADLPLEAWTFDQVAYEVLAR